MDIAHRSREGKTENKEELHEKSLAKLESLRVLQMEIFAGVRTTWSALPRAPFLNHRCITG